MQTASYLVLSLHKLLYAIETSIVREIFFLPELTPLEEAPEYIAGVVNLRGNIVPVMDLDVRLGHDQQRYRLSDKVIVLHLAEDNLDIGIIVNDVHDVKDIPQDQIEQAHFRNRKKDVRFHVITNEAKVDDHIIMLINHNHLVRFAEDMEELADLSSGNAQDKISQRSTKKRMTFCPDATDEERRVFQERANNIRVSVESKEMTGLIPLAVISLDTEYFGIDLDLVREFSELSNITPVPCTPDYIVGDINLRGDILTLLDIRGMLKLYSARNEETEKVMVVRLGNLTIGIMVDGVYDVVHLDPSELSIVPTAVKATSDEFVKGTVVREGKMISIIDLIKIVSREELVIDEEV